MARDRQGRGSRRKTSPFANLLAAAIGITIAVGLAEVMARVMFPGWSEFASTRFMTSAKVPGWPDVPVARPGFDGWFAQNNGDFRAHIVANAFGLRNVEPPEAADGRIWEVGDSFTFGWGIDINQTFGAVAATKLGLAWYNVASPGTDVCGYRVLLARMPKSARPKAVLLGLTLENDMLSYDCSGRLRVQEEGVAAPSGPSFRLPEFIGFKQALTQNSALYNFVAVSIKQVSSIESLLIGLHVIAPAAEDQRQFPEERMEDVLDSTASEIGRLRDELPTGTALVVIPIPSRLEVLRDDPFYRKQREGIVRRLAAMNIATADPFTRLKAEGMGAVHFPHDGHWTARGHLLAGEAAAETLRELLTAETPPQ
jgi:hypothetical protein